MTDRLKTIKTVTDVLSWLALYFAVLATVLYCTASDSQSYILAGTMLIPFGGTMLLYARSKNLAIYVAYHLLLCLLCFGLLRTTISPGAVRVGILIAAIIFTGILFLAKRVHAGDRALELGLSPFLAVIFFILWIIADGMKLPSLCAVLPVAACLYMLSQVLGIYLSNMIAYIESNKGMANMPASALIRSGNGQMGIFMILSFLAILLFTHMGLDQLLNQLKSLLLAGIRFLFSLAPNNTDEVVQEAVSTSQTPSMEAPVLDSEGPSPIAEAISDMFVSVVKIGLFVAAAILIVYGIYQLWLRFNGFSFQKKKKARGNDGVEDVVEKLDTKKKNRRAPWFSPALPEDKIRRIYYKKIQGRHKKEAVNQSLTPEELTASIAPADSDAAKEFTRIYEQARYGREPQPQDVAAYKNLAKKL